MNMKKTIAAVAAGAMAVSAMATSVSALADKSLTYNLVRHIYSSSNGEVTATATITVYGTDTIMSGNSIYVGFGDSLSDNTFSHQHDWKGDARYLAMHSITINAYEMDETGRVTGEVKKFTANAHDWEDGYVSGFNGQNGITISIGSNALAKELKTGTSYRFDITAVLTHTESSNKDLVNKVTAGTVLETPIVAYGSSKADAKPTGVMPAFKDFSAAGITLDYDAPFETSATKNQDIITYLEYDPYHLLTVPTTLSPDNGKSYKNVRAVINDAIANYDTVELTFNTATSGIKWAYYNKDGGIEKATSKSEAVQKCAVERSKDNNNTRNVVWAVYSTDADADKTYTTFQHDIYNGGYNLDGTSALWEGYNGEGYFGYDFTQENLFGAALIVNEYQTMSLADTDFFDWGTSSITFDWFAIYENSNTTPNAYATYVQTLKLLTSIDWYWDSMTVNVAFDSAEDAAAGAGATGDEGGLDDGDAGELDDGEGDISGEDDEAPAGDEDDGDEAPAGDEDEAEAPAVTTNPGTGNAPIALAVIPVALAAAAVVAKKRG